MASNIEKLRRVVSQAIGKNQQTEYVLVELAHHYLKRPLVPGEKIDIAFIFQSASFWPSWESVWEACVADPRFNATMVVCDESIKEKVQFKTAQSFLQKKGIPFQHIRDVNLAEMKPHIVVIHTPYDGHRPRALFGKRLTSQGFRTVYIPYGIEISDTKKARSDHFTGSVTTTAWRLYTFSQEIVPYYKLLSPTGGDMVRAFGHPKFDRLTKAHFPSLPEAVKARAKGRKVVLWKVHFPKKVDGELITPSLDMYEEFLDKLGDYPDTFFVFMPHPKFYAELEKMRDPQSFLDKIDALENVMEFNDDDYRPVLMNCDYYIIDRSALMVEAGVTGRPIAYVKTPDPEPMTEPVQKIVDSYYQASKLRHLIDFLDEVVVPDRDPKKEERLAVFESVIPDNGGTAGEQIIRDMAESLAREAEQDTRSPEGIPKEEFSELVERLFRQQDIYAARVEIERDRVRKHLSHRLGKAMIDAGKTPLGYLKLPMALAKAYQDFRENQRKGSTKLPPA